MLRTEESRSFVGLALVYGAPVYLDTASGAGVAEVLRRMSRFLDGFSRWRHADPAFEKSDMRQEAYTAALEGMRTYRQDCSAQLSTFLHRHVLNRMINIRRRLPLPRQTADLSELAGPIRIGPEEAIDLERAMESLGERWARIMRRILVDGEQIGDVAHDEHMSPWGLTKALNKRLVSTKRRLAR